MKLCIPENVTPERKRILRAYGAELVLTSPLEGSDGAIRKAREIYYAEELAKAGIDDTVARETLADLFENVDERQLIADALARRLRGRPLGTDRKVLQRLYRYLVSQGFSSQAVLAVLKASKGSFSTIDDHDVE